MASADDGWPDIIEEVKVRDREHAVVHDLADCVADSQPRPIQFDREDGRYLWILELLQMMKDGLSPILSLSDSVTSHVVNAVGFFVRDRSYRIVYGDPWGSEATFLQEGRNVAGIAAEHYRQVAWSVSHHELARVLDSAVAIRPDQDAVDGKEA
jgi:hypothetical protein